MIIFSSIETIIFTLDLDNELLKIIENENIIKKKFFYHYSFKLGLLVSPKGIIVNLRKIFSSGFISLSS